MKLLINLLICLAFTSACNANPFSSRLNNNSQSQSITTPRYIGYLHFSNQTFAILKIGDQEKTLEEGENVSEYYIKTIEPEYIIYEFQGKILQLNLESPK